MGDEKLVSVAYGYIRLALPLMSQCSIPVTPLNYTVWYNYVSDNNSELNKAIDTMQDKGGRVFRGKKRVALPSILWRKR
jgi:hypothetical protein